MFFSNFLMYTCCLLWCVIVCTLFNTQCLYSNMKFLEYARNLHKLLLTSSEPLKLVIGNSGADYDSIIGSLIYAFYLTICTQSIHLPIIDCLRDDFKLRFDASTILKQYQIDQQLLLFSQDIKESKVSNYSLYDHNSREVQINEIIDHHDFNQQNLQCTKHIIYPVGSALTLLYFLYHPQLMTENGPLQQLYRNYKSQQKIQCKHQQFGENQLEIIDQLIYYGIIIDCFNFDPAHKGRWTQYDQLACHHILKKRSTFKMGYEDLKNLKFSKTMNQQLTLKEHLKRDYKLYNYAGIEVEYSVITMDPTDFYALHDHHLKAHFANNKRLHLLMFVWPGQTKLERAVGHSSEQKITGQVKKILTKLKLEELKNQDGWVCWRDPASTISRKIVDKQMRIHFQKLKNQDL